MLHTATTLPPSSKRQIALTALIDQGQHGLISELARDYGVHRQVVYDLREQAQAALTATFEVTTEPVLASLSVAEPDLKRAAIALRVIAPVSVRDIGELFPVLFGVRWSVGKIQGVLDEANSRAVEQLKQVDLSGVENIALDEVFSLGKPLFSGIDLDSGYLFALDPAQTRSKDDWRAALQALEDRQGLQPTMVVKDAGAGMAGAVTQQWPDAEQRDDSFHAVWEAGKLYRTLEAAAYKAIERVESLLATRAGLTEATSTQRRQLGQQLRQARAEMDRRIARFDRYEELYRHLGQLLKVCVRGRGRLQERACVEKGLVWVGAAIFALKTPACRALGKYIANRAAGLASYLDALSTGLQAVVAADSQAGVDAMVRCWQASLEVEVGGPRWDRAARQAELTAAVRALMEETAGCPVRLQTLAAGVLPVLATRHRASSALECVHSVLRPYLHVQKGAHEGFLGLFQFYWNTRTRQWGRHKGTSALEALTGEKVEDWLTRLGYPPSEHFLSN
jgi:hypothetical protein